MKPTDLPNRRQAGMALVISLIVLLLLTILGLAAMQSSTLQEKMSGNRRDSEQAFLAAESALRNGEDFMESTSATTATFTVQGTNGLYDVSGNASSPVNWHTATNWITAASLGSEVAEQPRYLIEQLPEVVNKGISLEADQPEETVTIYRITANAVGKTTTSRTVLQSTFRR